MRQVQPQHLAFDLVAVELISGNVRNITNVRLAVVFETPVIAARGLPIETQVVFQIMLLKQVLFQVKHFGKIVSAQLHRGLAYFLMRRRNSRSLIQQ